MEEKKYEINGVTYVQRKLVLGQVLPLVDLLEGVEITTLEPMAIIRSLGGLLPRALAIVLTPEGTRVQDKDIPALAALFVEQVGIEMALEVIADFFSLNPLSALSNKYRGTMTVLIDKIKEVGLERNLNA